MHLFHLLRCQFINSPLNPLSRAALNLLTCLLICFSKDACKLFTVQWRRHWHKPTYGELFKYLLTLCSGTRLAGCIKYACKCSSD